jgi:hypothetical protein
MEKKELLDSLAALTARYEQHRHYIEKARAQAATGKFNVAVIEKVVLDHEIKASDVADQVRPLLPTLSEMKAALEADKVRVETSRGGVDEQIQELELRAMIGELSEPDFDQEVADLRANQSSANERLAAVQADWDALEGALQRWIVLAEPAGHYTAVAVDAQPPVAPAPEVEIEVPAPEPEATFEPVLSIEEATEAPAEFPEAVDADGSHGTRTEIREDLSEVYPAPVPESAHIRVASIEEDIAIETSEVNEDVGDAPSADVPFGLEEELLGGSAVGSEVEIDLAGDAAPAAAPSSESGEAPRRALLLYQEGTAEEQIYPFTGDTLTIGRGRENDIQIKNDSKVSRAHCKLFRRGNNFYIEDQKSSNGSLVNGELITDRRLFGGEEIIIGETFFRFRIME